MFLAFRCTSMDIIATYCFARCDNSLDATNFHDPLLMTMQSTIPFFWLIKFFSFLIPLVAVLPEKIFISFNSPFLAFIRLRNIITNQIDRILSDRSFFDTTQNWTIYHHLLGARVGKDGPSTSSRRDLFEEALSLLQAGSDTVGNTCTLGTFYILNDPDVHSRLFDELQEVWPDRNMQAEYTMLEKLPYLVRGAYRPQSNIGIDRLLTDRSHQRVPQNVTWDSDTFASNCRTYGRRHCRPRRPGWGLCILINVSLLSN